MRLFDLFESTNVAELVRQFGSKLSRRIANDKSVPDDIDPEHFIIDIDNKFNPTNKHDVLQWLIKTYADGGIRYYEDFSKAKQYLEVFFKYRNQMPVSALYRIKSLSDLGSMVGDFEKDKHATHNERDYAKETSKVVYDGPEGMVLQPYTKGASCVYGRGTQWCISATKSDNYFNNYSFDDDVNFLFVFPKDGSKWAIAVEDTGHFDIWDEEDNIVKQDVFFKKYPWVKDIVDSSDLQHPKPSHRDIKKMKPYEIVALLRDGEISIDDIKDVRLSAHQQMALVNYDASTIAAIKNPTSEAQVDAINKNWNMINYLENPSTEAQIAAIKKSMYAIGYIKNPSEEAQLYAIASSPHLLEFINNPTDKVKLEAINKNAWTLQYIKNPTAEERLLAVSRNGLTIKYIKNPTEQEQLAAVQNDGNAIEFIDKPSNEVQVAAIKEDKWAYSYIKNPTKQATALAKRKSNETS